MNLIINQSIAGSFVNAIYGFIIGLVIPLFIAYLYIWLTKKECVGGGTIKLSAMIGSWVGLLILPIIALTILILVIQFIIITILSKLPGDLKWSNEILTPRLYSKFSKLSVPTSTAITLATLFVILITHRKI
jgi:prepilin signal peptidase PulO-like enzyme (type II secretory pathway)